MSNDTTFEPSQILANCQHLNPQQNEYLKHDLIQRFGSPQQPIYVDEVDTTINGLRYEKPFILPIYNGQLELIQCAVLQNNKPVQIIPDGLAKGFAYYGELRKDQPIIITHNLEAFFKIAQTGYAVVLVMLPNLCTKPLDKPKAYDFKQIQFVVDQLEKSGFIRLYMPVRPEQINLKEFIDLEQNTALRLISQYLVIDEDDIRTEHSINLDQYDSSEEVSLFFDESIKRLPVLNKLPKGHLAKPFAMEKGAYLHILDTGLHLVKEQQDENGETKQTRTFISQSIIVLGEARSVNSDNWKRVIQFKDKDTKQHTLLIPYEHFMGEAQEALKIIANHGLMPPRQAYKKNVFIQYIQDYPIEQRFRCVERTGWHQDVFVTPTKTFGNCEAEPLLFHHEGHQPYSTQGSLEGWQQLSQLIEPHALGVLAFSCAFAGQLVAPLGVESGGFHIYGSSTDGKSTITKAACSVWGNPKDISKSWRTTDNALENEAELRNDSFLNLDELRQAVPKAVSDIVYMLTGGQGKARSSKAGKNRDMKHFSLMYCSTGEVTLEEHLRRGNIELDAGLLLRFAHLPSDAGKGHGVFEEINEGTSPQELGNQINALAAQHYGFAGIQWLEYLTADKTARMVQAQALFERFIQSYENTRLNGQASRVLRRFALVAVAGELATQAGITAWQTGRALAALKQCFDIWLSHFGTGSNLEESRVLEHIRAFLEANGTSRFEDLTVLRHADGEIVRQRTQNRVGYYDPETKTYLVFPSMFKKEMCIGINEISAKKVLTQAGWLETFNEGSKLQYSKKVSRALPDGTRPRLMHFSVEAMQRE